MEWFPEQSLAVLNAAEVFDPTKCPPTKEDHYYCGCDKVVVLAGHYSLEKTVTLSEWKVVAMDISSTQDFLLSLVNFAPSYWWNCKSASINAHAFCRLCTALGQIKTRLLTESNIDFKSALRALHWKSLILTGLWNSEPRLEIGDFSKESPQFQRGYLVFRYILLEVYFYCLFFESILLLIL